MSADKDTKSPDSSVSSLSGRTDRQRTAFFFENSGQNPDTIFRKIRTKTRQRQDTDNAVRRRLIYVMILTLRKDRVKKNILDVKWAILTKFIFQLLKARNDQFRRKITNFVIFSKIFELKFSKLE